MKSIPFMQIRGGSSKGLFFNAKDLPTDEKLRNETILLAMEGNLVGDARQIDGLGGANSLTSKVAIVGRSENPAYDLEYYFIQVVVGKGRVSTIQTCGNILAGVLPFAIESGMISANSHVTSAKINILNTGGICEVVVQTPDNQVEYAGNTKIDGVVGTAAPIVCNYLDTVGSTCGALLPTGNTIDVFDGIKTTCIDNGMPIVIMQASDFGLAGDENKETLEANEVLKAKVESIRLQAGKSMNLGDVREQTIPKICLISKGKNGGVINTRMFIPHVVHEAIGVLAAVSVATACILPNSVCEKIMINEQFVTEMEDTHNQNSEFRIARRTAQNSELSIEHPSGEFTVNLEYEFIDNQLIINKSGVIRTARLLSKGEVFIPKI